MTLTRSRLNPEPCSTLAQVLDAALTRPGRLSRRVLVPLPDEQGRADILQACPVLLCRLLASRPRLCACALAASWICCVPCRWDVAAPGLQAV